MFRLPPALNTRHSNVRTLPLVLGAALLLAAVFLAALALAGCSSRVPQTRHEIHLTGDNAPQADLAEGESRVLAMGEDGEHAPPLNNLFIELFDWVDKDQVPPVQRTEDLPPAVHLNARQYILFGNDWTTVKQVNMAKLEGEERVQHLRYLVINHGDKTFRGDLSIQGHPDRALLFLDTTAVFKVLDRREIKEALAFIPPLGLLALNMENYLALDELLNWSVETQGGRFHYLIRNLTLEPYQGVIIEYSAELVLPGE